MHAQNVQIADDTRTHGHACLHVDYNGCTKSILTTQHSDHEVYK